MPTGHVQVGRGLRERLEHEQPIRELGCGTVSPGYRSPGAEHQRSRSISRGPQRDPSRTRPRSRSTSRSRSRSSSALRASRARLPRSGTAAGRSPPTARSRDRRDPYRADQLGSLANRLLAVAQVRAQPDVRDRHRSTVTAANSTSIPDGPPSRLRSTPSRARPRPLDQHVRDGRSSASSSAIRPPATSRTAAATWL